MEITREMFDAQRRPRFGTGNPERMQLEFWEWMIRGDQDSAPDEGVLGQLGLMMREGVLKSGYGPWRARDHFGIGSDCANGPIWTFDRMGATQTELPDGRVVCIGGEHEDHYDPDFNIYNDVIVFGPNDTIEICGYPKDVFPPTDFHTATLVGDQIIVIGCLGYPADRRPGFTPVYALDTVTYRLSPIVTAGEMPGWVWKHTSELEADGTISVRGGEVVEDRAGKQHFRRNLEDYTLDLATGAWRRMTNRNWEQWRVRRTDGKWFDLDPLLRPEAVVPVSVPSVVVPCEEINRARVVIAGVPVDLTVSYREVEVVIEGRLPDALARTVLEEVRTRTESTIGQPCVLERV